MYDCILRYGSAEVAIAEKQNPAKVLPPAGPKCLMLNLSTSYTYAHLNHGPSRLLGSLVEFRSLHVNVVCIETDMNYMNGIPVRFWIIMLHTSQYLRINRCPCIWPLVFELLRMLIMNGTEGQSASLRSGCPAMLEMDLGQFHIDSPDPDIEDGFFTSFVMLLVILMHLISQSTIPVKLALLASSDAMSSSLSVR